MNKRKGSYSYQRHDIQQLSKRVERLDFNNTIVKKKKTLRQLGNSNTKFKKKHLFMAALVFTAVQAFSLYCSKRGLHCGAWSSHCIGFSSLNMGSRHVGSAVVAHRLNCSTTWPGSSKTRIKPMSPALTVDS